ncbi:MAG: helix-turn-helix domain-containing protein [Bauldia sp.]|nr:helix-turn-helix domain-containing protein [Bauldia sp.]
MDSQNKEMLDELRFIRKLLILQLLGQGVKQRQIAAMLGLSEATVSRMIPRGVTRESKPKASDKVGSSDEN